MFHTGLAFADAVENFFPAEGRSEEEGRENSLFGRVMEKLWK